MVIDAELKQQCIICSFVANFLIKQIRSSWSNYNTSIVLQSIVAVFSKITTTNVAALIVGLTCIVLLLIGKEINLRYKKKLPVPIPMEIIVVSRLRSSLAKLFNYSKAVELISLSIKSNWALG